MLKQFALKTFCAFLLTLLTVGSWPVYAVNASLPDDSPWAFARPAIRQEKDQITAQAYLVYDTSSRELVLAQDPDKKLYPASTTKIMTAVLALETLALDKKVTASAQAVALGANSSKVGLVSGEQTLVRDLLAGLMVASGNDAANVLAEAIAGSNESFAWYMNKKAQALGLTDTHFCNPSGLHEDAHVSTARDLAVLTAYALEDEHFRQLVSLATYAMPASNKHPYLGWSLLSNTNRFLLYGDTAFASPYIKSYSGVKTGSTNYAGNCLVSAAVLSDGRELICVVLGAGGSQGPNSIYCDSLWLFEAAAQKLGLDPEKPAETLPTGENTAPTPALSPTAAPTASPAPTPTLAPLPTLAVSPALTDQASLAPEPGKLPLVQADLGNNWPDLLRLYWPGILFGAGAAGLIFLSCWLLLGQKSRQKRRRAKVRPRRLL